MNETILITLPINTSFNYTLYKVSINIPMTTIYNYINTLFTLHEMLSLVYYPLLFLIIIIVPLIILIATLILKISNETKVFILFVNIIYSILSPIAEIAIIKYFLLGIYVYETILNNHYLVYIFFIFNLPTSLAYEHIALVTILYVIVNVLLVLYYITPEKDRKIKILKIFMRIFKIFKFFIHNKSEESIKDNNHQN
jgi:hypothetical protein